MKTNASFIHEYDVVDDFTEYVIESVTTLDECVVDYNNLVREYELKSFFEGSQNEEKVSTKKEGIFTRIGNIIINLIKSIGNIITKFVSKFTSRNKEIETDEKIVNRICSEHPEIRQEVVEGIEKEWFTYHNIAEYKNDIVGLCMMLRKKKIDNRTFKEKCSERFHKLLTKGRTIVIAGATVASLMALVPKLAKAYKGCKDTMGDVKKNLEKTKKDLQKCKPKPLKEAVSLSDVVEAVPIETISAIVQELSKVSSFVTKEMKHVVSGQGKISSVLKGIIRRYKK